MSFAIPLFVFGPLVNGLEPGVISPVAESLQVLTVLFLRVARFDTAYTLIPHTIIYLTTDGSLEEFQTDDVKMVGIKDTLIEDIDRRLDWLGCWRHVGDGVWRRDTSVKVWKPGQTQAQAHTQTEVDVETEVQALVHLQA